MFQDISKLMALVQIYIIFDLLCLKIINSHNKNYSVCFLCPCKTKHYQFRIIMNNASKFTIVL